MSARTVRGIVFAALITVTSTGASAKGANAGALLVWNPILSSSIERLSSESRTFRDAIESVAPTGRRVVLTTPDRLPDNTSIEFDSRVLAQAYPLSDPQSHVDAVIVVCNLELLQKLSGLSTTAVDFEDDLDRIVAHEVYGHAIPVALAGNLSGNCADPAVGQSAMASCAVQRENVIRREMNLGVRLDYGRDSPALARSRHF